MASAISPRLSARWWTKRALAAVACLAGVAYVGWRLTTLGTGGMLWLSIPLLVTEVWALAGFGVLISAAWTDPEAEAPRAAELGSFPRVPVLIDADGATEAELERSLIALIALRGAGETIVVVDDDVDFDAVAQRFGATVEVGAGPVLHRMAALDAPLALWLTAGQVVLPDLLASTVPRFDDPTVATCQVAVTWLNADSLAHMRGGRDQDALTRDVLGPALAARGVAPWSGAGSIVRTDAARSLPEAARTTADAAHGPLFGAGYSSTYEPRDLIRGIAPDTLADYLATRQDRTAAVWRGAWKPGGVFRGGQRSAASRIGALHHLLSATAGVRLLLQVALLGIVMMTGVLPFTAASTTVAATWLTIASLRALARRAIAEGAMGALDWTRQAWRTLPADAAALLGRSPRGRHTTSRHPLRSALGTLWPLALTILTLDLVLLARGWTLVRPDALPRLATSDRVLVLLAGLAMLVPLADVVLGVARRRQRRAAPRLETSLPISVGEATARTVDISPGGVGLLLDAAPAVGSLATFDLTLPSLEGGTEHVVGTAHVRSATADPSGRVRVGLEFANLSPSARVALIGYCGVGHAIEFVDHSPTVVDPGGLDIDLGASRRPVRGMTGFAVAAGVAALIAGPSAGVAVADDTLQVTQVCVRTTDGDPVADAVVSRVGPDGDELLGSSDTAGCVAVAPSPPTDRYRAVLGGIGGTSSDASGGVVTVTLTGRSVLVLDTNAEPLDVEIRTFTDAWSEPTVIAGRTTLAPDPRIEAVEITWEGVSVVEAVDGDVVVVLAVLVADPGAAVTEIERGAGWEPFVDGMQVLPGRITLRLDDGGIVKLDVPGDHRMTVPSGTITRLDLTPAPTPAPPAATPSSAPGQEPTPTTPNPAGTPSVSVPTADAGPTPTVPADPSATAEPTPTQDGEPTPAASPDPDPTAPTADPTPDPDPTAPPPSPRPTRTRPHQPPTPRPARTRPPVPRRPWSQRPHRPRGRTDEPQDARRGRAGFRRRARRRGRRGVERRGHQYGTRCGHDVGRQLLRGRRGGDQPARRAGRPAVRGRRPLPGASGDGVCAGQLRRQPPGLGEAARQAHLGHRPGRVHRPPSDPRRRLREPAGDRGPGLRRPARRAVEQPRRLRPWDGRDGLGSPR